MNMQTAIRRGAARIASLAALGVGLLALMALETPDPTAVTISRQRRMLAAADRLTGGRQPIGAVTERLRAADLRDHDVARKALEAAGRERGRGRGHRPPLQQRLSVATAACRHRPG